MTADVPDRVVFLVDGFNLYHSLVAAEKRFGANVKWLDLPSLCKAHLYILGVTARLETIRYFTALAHHLHRTDPNKIVRHKTYVRALTATRVQVNVGHFKQKIVANTWTRQEVTSHEEKETDVAMACAVLEGGVAGDFDTAVLVTGDTDLRPAVHAFRRMCPAKRLVFAFPFARENRELAQVAPGSFSFSAAAYRKHQFPERVPLPSGKFVTQPPAWRATAVDQKDPAP